MRTPRALKHEEEAAPLNLLPPSPPRRLSCLCPRLSAFLPRGFSSQLLLKIIRASTRPRALLYKPGGSGFPLAKRVSVGSPGEGGDDDDGDVMADRCPAEGFPCLGRANEPRFRLYIPLYFIFIFYLYYIYILFYIFFFLTYALPFPARRQGWEDGADGCFPKVEGENAFPPPSSRPEHTRFPGNTNPKTERSSVWAVKNHTLVFEAELAKLPGFGKKNPKNQTTLICSLRRPGVTYRRSRCCTQ